VPEILRAGRTVVGTVAIGILSETD